MGIQQQKQSAIMVIGDSCTDVYEFGTCERISPEAPVPVFKKSHSESRSGMAKNVYENLKGLGCDVNIVTNDEDIIKTRIIDEVSGYQLLRIDNDPKIRPLKPDLLSTGFLAPFSAVVISDYDKGFIDYNIKEIVDKCNSSGVPVFVDSKKKDLRCFEGCILKLNNYEYNNVEFFPKNYEFIVTLGKEGAMWNNTLFPSVSTDVFDVCGAGDTFLAAFVYKYLITKDFSSSISFANGHAAESVKVRGTYVIQGEDE